jgi:beta-glucosidase
VDQFVWGVSTAAFQIEGAVSEDGRGPSVWDTFVHEPGRVATGETADVACDHYHRYAEDVDLIAELGVDAYHFSTSWSRVLPQGRGAVNPAGLGFYDRLIDALVAWDIDPVVNLFHWDLPQALEDEGGWLNRDCASWFADYADVVASHFGDRVRMWITLEEPFVHTALGYAFGLHAPGQALMLDALPTAHHQLLGHGRAVNVLRGHSSAPVTIANNYTPVRVVGDTDADRFAADAYDALHNRLFTDPLFGRGYPDGFDLPVRDGDLETIAAPLDGLGVNYYYPTGIRAPVSPEAGLPFDIVPIEGYPVTDYGWPVVPEGLGDILTRLYTENRVPLYVTESGCAYAESPDDQRRIDYLAAHIDTIDAVRAQGVDVRGYFVWSIMDNFEWAEGYSKRFGLVHVDFDTLARTPNASYVWLRDRIAASI